MLQRMTADNARKTQVRLDLEAVTDLIATVQKPSGEIPWHIDGKTDPWDHVEAAMGLTVGGNTECARKAYQWLAENQRSDGSWYAAYLGNQPLDRTLDTNFCAYLGVGLYHYHLCTGDISFIENMWPTLQSAIDFTIDHQAPGGEIYWAVSPQGKVDRMALLTGSSAVYMSLKCVLSLADELNRKTDVTFDEKRRNRWRLAWEKLGHAILERPHHFNMTKSRFAMDWFYPILCGVVTDAEAHKRINRYWKKFVIENEGVRCVSDKPWVTLAETAELIMALEAMGNRDQAQIVFDWIFSRRFSDGTFLCGFNIPQREIWPKERMTWTNAAVLLAADTLFDLTSASCLFRHSFWNIKQN